MKAYEERLSRMSIYVGLASLIFTIGAGMLLILVSWQWWIVVQFLGLAFAFLSLAYREEREEIYHWYFTISFFFWGTFMIALIVQLVCVFTK